MVGESQTEIDDSQMWFSFIGLTGSWHMPLVMLSLEDHKYVVSLPDSKEGHLQVIRHASPMKLLGEGRLFLVAS